MNDFMSKITQIAYTELNQGIEIDSHIHETMEEIFFLLEGICEFFIQDKKIIVEEQTIIRIPIKCKHSLKAITNCKFYYFGVSI